MDESGKQSSGSILRAQSQLTVVVCLLLSLFLASAVSVSRAWAGWTQQTSGTLVDLRGTCFVDISTGYAVGQSGTILKTTDGGSTWNLQTSGTFPDLSGTFFVDMSTGYAVGGIGTIVKTTDGGSTWNPQTSGTFLELLSVYFLDASTGYAVGRNGIILKTINGGSTWNPQFSGTFQELRGTYFVDMSTGYAVGGIGTIVKTTDGGSTWNPRFSGTFQDLRGTYFLDASTGYAVGRNGTILKTTDGGSTWNPQSPGTIKDLNGVSFLDPWNEYAVGGAGTIIKTSDGGSGAAGSSISGRIFEDANFAGTASDYDGGTSDIGLANVDVELYNNSNGYITSVNTAANGIFTFTGLPNLTYKVRVRSSTIGDAGTLPRGGLNASVPGTWPYPLPEMTWGNGSALYGGQSATVDDTATGDNLGPGDTYVSVTVSGADVSDVNLGFAYNLIVNTDDDINADNVRSKQGSLRQFIKNANAIGTAGGTTANSSQFRIRVPTPLPGFNAVASIAPVAALPAISDATGGTIIDGTTQTVNNGDTNSNGPEIELDGASAGAGADGLTIKAGASTIRGLVINRFSKDGIDISIGGGNTVAGNYIGTDVTGLIDQGNSLAGIIMRNGSSNNLIGGTTAADRNVISGNGWDGVVIKDPGTDSNVIEGNYLGTDMTGSGALGNGHNGVFISLSAANNSIGGTAGGVGNLIANNLRDGVSLVSTAGTGNKILRNSISANTELGIDLDDDGVTANDTGDADTGPNNLQNFPVLTSATTLEGVTTVEGGLNSAAATTFRIEFFASPAEDPSGYGEGQTYLGSTTIITDGSGDQSFTFLTSVPVGQVITTTATDPNDNTSEFSGARPVIEGNDIGADCDFSDWTDGDGTEFVIDDNGGPDDWTSPPKYDITRFGVASNLSDTFYLLFGFDDISPDKSSAAVLIDTDLDGNINFALTTTLLKNDGSEVELFTCDNTLPYGCGNQTSSEIYTTPEDYCVGTGTGPWNTDTFVEVQLPYSDLGSFTGGTSILTSLTSYDRGDLAKPKDTIYLDYYDRTLYDADTGEGETIDTVGTFTIGGTVFLDEGATSAGIGKTVALLVNGSLADTDITDQDGYWFMVVPTAAGDNLLAYIDGDATYRGATVTVSNGTVINDMDIYAAHCITRHDNGGTLSTANMASAKGGSADSDILYSVSGGTNLNVTGPGTELFVPIGYSFAPGGDVTTPNMKNLGTFTGGAGVIDINGTLTLSGGSFTATSGAMSVAGDFTHSGGTFSHNSGTVILDGTGQGVSGTTDFNHLTKTVTAADTLTFEAGSTQSIAGTVTLEGTDGNLLNLRSSSEGTRWNFTVNAGAIKDISYVDVKDSDASGSDASRKPINPSYSIDSGNTIDWFELLPDIILLKSVQTFSDPYNDETNPKAIPGAVMIYTVAATNQGYGATDADTVVITDQIPANTALFVGDIDGPGPATGPVQFIDGAIPSGLTYTFISLDSPADDVAFSNDGGGTYTYVPEPDAEGCDTNVTHIRINPKGTFDAASGGNFPTFEIKFKVRVE
ncbi:MAG: YCF48-related protein [Candidatus Eisenbacteria bacterium]